MAEINVTNKLNFRQLEQIIKSHNIKKGDPTAIEMKNEYDVRYIIGKYNRIEQSPKSPKTSIILGDAMEVSYPYEGLNLSGRGWSIQFPRKIRHSDPLKESRQELGHSYFGRRLIITQPAEIIIALDNAGLQCISKAFQKYINERYKNLT